MNLDELLAPRSDEKPSGDNLEYDPLFIELEQAVSPGEDHQMDADSSASKMDVAAIAQKSLQILEKSHDLRAAAYWAVARARMDGFHGFAEAISYIEGCISLFWDTCYPPLQIDDEYDPMMRSNALAILADRVKVILPLSKLPLLTSKGLKLTLKDILEVKAVTKSDQSSRSSSGDDEDTEKKEARKPNFTAASLKIFLKKCDPQALRECFDCVQGINQSLQKIEQAFREKANGTLLNLDLLKKMLRSIISELQPYLQEVKTETPAAEKVDGTADSSSDDQNSEGGNFSLSGELTKRAEVVVALEKIMTYYSIYEPSSPLPLFLARAIRLIDADFLTIIRDMAPAGLETIMMIGGIVDSDMTPEASKESDTDEENDNYG